MIQLKVVSTAASPTYILKFERVVVVLLKSINSHLMLYYDKRSQPLEKLLLSHSSSARILGRSSLSRSVVNSNDPGTCRS